MNPEEYLNEKLWPVLVGTAHALVLYANHKAYSRDVILPKKPDMTPSELAARLRMPLGEALVILYELSLGEEKKSSDELEHYRPSVMFNREEEGNM